MNSRVGWDSLLMGLFCPKLRSNGSRRGGQNQTLDCRAELALEVETDLFNFQFIIILKIVTI